MVRTVVAEVVVVVRSSVVDVVGVVQSLRWTH